MAIDATKDEEVLDTILEAFEDDGRLDMDYVDIEVVDGGIILGGRVSTEEEMEIVDEVMQGIKLTDYTNNIWVDESLAIDASDEDNGGLKNLQFDDEDLEESEFEEEEDDSELM